MNLIQLHADARLALISKGDHGRGAGQEMAPPKVRIRNGREDILLDSQIPPDYPPQPPHDATPVSRRRARLVTNACAATVRAATDHNNHFSRRLDARHSAAARTAERLKRQLAA